MDEEPPASIVFEKQEPTQLTTFGGEYEPPVLDSDDSDEEVPRSIQYERPLLRQRRKRVDWRGVTDIDTFLKSAYHYYYGKGFLCIILSRLTHLGTTLFVVCLSTFVLYSIDYDKIHSTRKLSDSLQNPFLHMGYLSLLVFEASESNSKIRTEKLIINA